jgi:1-deoxy-D-xylulose-5-phosphate synthase
VQRSYDCIIHDICLQNLPVTFCLDRAGLSPNDGPTHHGLFDIAFLRCVPNATVMQPKDEDELVDMLHTSLATPSATFIRFPRGPGAGVRLKDQPALLPLGKAEELRTGTDIVIWALGPMVALALELSDRLLADHELSVGVVNARFAKPLDRALLREHASRHGLIATMEDHVLAGGFGSAVLEALQEAGLTPPVERIGWPDRFVDHGNSVESLRAANGLAPEDCLRRLLERYKQIHRTSLEALL